MQYSYDYFLVFLSVVLAVFSSFASLNLVVRIPQLSGKKVYLWLAGGSLAMGVGIWSMHFVGMLAFHLPIYLVYDTGLTIASLAIAVFSSALALLVARYLPHTWPVLLASALLFGLGVASMHYTGMAAILIYPPVEYDPAVVILSVLIAILASVFALRFAFFTPEARHGLFSKNNLRAALVMGLAIAGMHYTGMAAAHFSAESYCVSTESGINHDLLALAIAILSSFVLLLTLLPLLFEMRLAEQNAFLVEQLQKHNETLERRAEEMAYSMTEQLRKSAERDRMLATIIDQTNEAIITVNVDNQIVTWNESAQRIYGYHKSEVLGRPFQILVWPEEGAWSGQNYLQNQLAIMEVFRHRSQAGRVIYVNINQALRYDEDGLVIGKIYMVRDISRYHDAQQQLILWGSAYRYSHDGIVICDAANQIMSVNEAFSRITGYEPDEVIGKTPALLASGRHDCDFYREMWQGIQQQGMWSGEIWNKRKNGEVFPERLTITVIRDDENNISNYIGIFSDITSDKKKEEYINQLAYYDQLTGLPNRILMYDRLRQALLQASVENKKVGVMFLDLDRFKNVNDSLGHSLGDQLLQEIARRLKRCVEPQDTVCRQGGDEFIIIFPDIGHEDKLALTSERIISNVSNEVRLGFDKISISPSIGIAVFPQDGLEPDVLIKNADMAMYAAKNNGRSQYQFFTEELDRQMHQKMSIERELTQAIKDNALQLFLQPQVNSLTEQICGAEVLLRWFHPELGEISPAVFVPIAEESGLIATLGDWALQRAVVMIGDWLSENPALAKIRFSVNLSGKQLNDPEFSGRVAAILQQSGLPGHMLELEITETAIMKNVQESYRLLTELKNHEIRIAIDDFGTGYSSLNYLKLLPINLLKIDRSFIQDLSHDENDRKITQAIISLAATLEIDLVAEGVETKEQLAFLQAGGCHVVQGFYYYPPLPPESFRQLLASSQVV